MEEINLLKGGKAIKNIVEEKIQNNIHYKCIEKCYPIDMLAQRRASPTKIAKQSHSNLDVCLDNNVCVNNPDAKGCEMCKNNHIDQTIIVEHATPNEKETEIKEFATQQLGNTVAVMNQDSSKLSPVLLPYGVSLWPSKFIKVTDNLADLNSPISLNIASSNPFVEKYPQETFLNLPISNQFLGPISSSLNFLNSINPNEILNPHFNAYDLMLIDKQQTKPFIVSSGFDSSFPSVVPNRKNMLPIPINKLEIFKELPPPTLTQYQSVPRYMSELYLPVKQMAVNQPVSPDFVENTGQIYFKTNPLHTCSQLNGLKINQNDLFQEIQFSPFMIPIYYQQNRLSICMLQYHCKSNFYQLHQP